MNRAIAIAGLLLLLASQRAIAQTGAKPAPKLANPGTVVRQLMRMTPEQRERALEKLPPQRQAQIRERLREFDNLPKAEQQRRLQLGEIFANLPSEKQDLVRHQIQAFNQLPDERRRVVGGAFQRLRRLPESERQARLASPQFRTRFSPAEQQILADLSNNWPPPTQEALRP